jgi:galactokinase
MFKLIAVTALVGVIASTIAFNYSDDTEYTDYKNRHHANQESLNQLESSHKYLSDEMKPYFEKCLNEHRILTVKKVRKCTISAAHQRATDKFDSFMVDIINQ